MLRYMPILIVLSLAACGTGGGEEYALNRSALAPGVGFVGGPVKGINPVNGQLIGGMGGGPGMPDRAFSRP